MSFLLETAEFDTETFTEEQVAENPLDYGDGSFATLLYHLYREEPDGSELSVQIWSSKIEPDFAKLSETEQESFEDFFRDFCSEFFIDDEEKFHENSSEVDEVKKVIVFFEHFVEYAQNHGSFYQLAKVFKDRFEKLEARMNAHHNEINHDEAYTILKNVIRKNFDLKRRKSDTSTSPKEKKPKKIKVSKNRESLEIGNLSLSLGDLNIYDNNIVEYQQRRVKVTSLIHRFFAFLMTYPDRLLRPGEIISSVLNTPETELTAKQMNYIPSWRRTFNRKVSHLGINPDILLHRPRAGYIFLSSYVNSTPDLTEQSADKPRNSKHWLMTFKDADAPTYQFGCISLKHDSSTGWEIKSSGKCAHLGETEATLLLHFFKNPDTDFTAEQLLNACWHEPSGAEIKSSKVVTMAGKLRRNLVEIGFEKDVIVPIGDGGYSFNSWQI